MQEPAIFLDRDGVINENLPDHVRSWHAFRFLPGALTALRSLTALRVPLFVVTNQAAIARHLVTQECIEDIHQRMHAHIRQAGGEITEILYCPHDASAGCLCRKPAPGMLLAAATRFNLDLRRSVLIGDALTDVIAGQRAGCSTILVQTGRGHEALRALQAGAAPRPTAFAVDLLSAVPLVTRFMRDHPVEPSSAALSDGPTRVSIGAHMPLAASTAD